MESTTTQIEIILQGKVESFTDFEKRLNKKIAELHKANPDKVVSILPCCASDGRMTMTLQVNSIIELAKMLLRIQPQIQALVKSMNNDNIII